MKLLSPIDRLLGRIGLARISSSFSAWLRGGEVATGTATLRSAYEQSVWVYACISAIAEQISQIPFRFSVGERGGEQIVERGPVVDLFNRPHPYLDRFLFWELAATYAFLRGKVYCLGLDRGGAVMPLNGSFGPPPSALILLNPDKVQPEIRSHQLLFYRYTAQQDDPLPTQEFLPEEMLCLRFPHPFAFYDGVAPAAVAQLAAQTDYSAGQFMKGVMSNNADTGLVVGTDQQLTKEQQDQIAARLMERRRASGTVPPPLFLHGGLKVEKPTISNVDLQFLENRKFSRQEICAVFRVPQEIIGFSEDANRAVADAVRLSFIENRILPFCDKLESFIEPIVRLFGENLFGWFDPESLPIMQAARRSRFTSAQIGFGMGVPLEQLNTIFDLGLSSDLPHWEKSYLPFSLQEVGSETEPANNSAPAPGASPSDTESPEPDEAAQESLHGLGALASEIRKQEAPAPAPHICAPASAPYEASLTASIKLKQSVLRRFFFEQRGRVLARLSQAIDSSPSPLKGERAGVRGQVSGELASIAIRSIDDIFNAQTENATLLQRMRPHLVADMEFGGAQLFRELNLEDFRVPPSEALSFLGKRDNKLRDVNQSTFDQLRSELSTGLENGETFEELVGRVKSVFNEAADSRAETIALTETNTAVNSGRFIGMREAGVDLKGWRTSNLAGVRATHQQAEIDYAKGIPLDEPFIVGGEALMHPGDPNGSPGNVINCRCFTYAIKSPPSPPPGERGGVRGQP